MNAGSYGTEIRDVLEWATVVERDGRRRRLDRRPARALLPADRARGHRRHRHPRPLCALAWRPRGLAGADRRAQPAPLGEPAARAPNAGSVFRNPEGDHAGRLIELCGLKGRRGGGARISPKHANVIVNEKGATAADVLDLMLLARREVKRRFGVELRPELVLTGSLAGRWRRRAA